MLWHFETFFSPVSASYHNINIISIFKPTGFMRVGETIYYYYYYYFVIIINFFIMFFSPTSTEFIGLKIN